MLMSSTTKERAGMFMKIGDITGKLGISNRSLHYWEDMGIMMKRISKGSGRFSSSASYGFR